MKISLNKILKNSKKSIVTKYLTKNANESIMLTNHFPEKFGFFFSRLFWASQKWTFIFVHFQFGQNSLENGKKSKLWAALSCFDIYYNYRLKEPGRGSKGVSPL